MLTHALADPRNRAATGAGVAAAATVLALPTGMIATGHVLALGVLVAALAAAAWVAKLGGRLHAAAARRARAARTDEVTGMLNRRGLVALGARPQAGAALLLVRLADPAVGADLGAAATERVLRAIGARLRATTRSGDLVARLDDDAFAVLLAPGTDPEALATRVLGRVREPVPFAGAVLRPDATLTVTAACGDAALDELLRTAVAA